MIPNIIITKKMKKLIFLLLTSLLIGSYNYVKSEDMPLDDPFSVEPFKKSRDFGVIDRETGENNMHDILFKSVWMNAEYSVYVWKHNNSDFYEIKSSYASDVTNFMSVTDAMGYHLTDVKYRKDGRKHVKFKCEDFANKLIKDTRHMLEIR